MLLGQFEGKVTRKFQTAFPKKFRNELGEKIVITKSIDSCLFVVSEKNWSILLEGTENMPFTDQATRELQRYLFGNAASVSLDQQGRFVLPEYLRKYAHIKEDLVFVGVQRYVELWNKDLWKENQDKVSKSIDLLTVNLSQTKGHE